MADSRVEKWRRWCEDRIRAEILTMYLHRYAWRQVGDIVDTNGQLPDSYFWEYLRDTYAVTQAVAVRRQADTDPRAVTLGRLLFEISEDAERITRACYIGLWDTKREPDLLFANADFDKFAPGGGDHVDPAIPQADLVTLQSISSKVSKFVDRNLAHSDPTPLKSGLPTLQQVHDAIDVIGELFNKYQGVLTASTYAFLGPTSAPTSARSLAARRPLGTDRILRHLSRRATAMPRKCHRSNVIGVARTSADWAGLLQTNRYTPRA